MYPAVIVKALICRRRHSETFFGASPVLNGSFLIANIVTVTKVND